MERKAALGRRASKFRPWWKQVGLVLELVSGLSSRGRSNEKECGARVIRDRPSRTQVDMGAMPTKAVG